MKERYRYTKTFVLEPGEICSVTPGLFKTISHTCVFEGIIQKRFFLTGFMYHPICYDLDVSEYVKIFNYNDPVYYHSCQVSTGSNDIIGDDVQLNFSSGSVRKDRQWFRAGILYDLTNCPIYIPNNDIQIGSVCNIDVNYIPVGEVKYQDRFTITLGTDEPLEFAPGQSIPPKLIK